jgi:hypothetical protein
VEKADMSTLVISLPEDRLRKLEDIARRFGIAPEELVRASIEELLTRPEEDFRRALDFVLNKNAELYRRLA